LNNPAAAARRAAVQLHETTDAVQSFLCQLGKVLSPPEWPHLRAAEQDALQRLDRSPPLDSVARSDREETLARWLDQNGIAEGWKRAPNFVTAGLGLMISNRIIAAHHGGEIEFESKPGETRFKVRLPVAGRS